MLLYCFTVALLLSKAASKTLPADPDIAEMSSAKQQ
jgi:hypothetical protein